MPLLLQLPFFPFALVLHRLFLLFRSAPLPARPLRLLRPCPFASVLPCRPRRRSPGGPPFPSCRFAFRCAPTVFSRAAPLHGSARLSSPWDLSFCFAGAGLQRGVD